MKYLFVIVLAIGCAIGARGQEYDNVVVEETSVGYNIGNYDTLTIPTFDYKKTKEWKRYMTLRAVGWSFLGVSVPTTLIGVAILMVGEDLTNANPIVYLPVVAGGVLFVASIPILISAYHFRDKAKKMGVSLSTITTPRVGGGMAYNYAPALSVAITF